jgi:LDH2 family malate/lactate/ureidoglycolate dehydrogenase
VGLINGNSGFGQVVATQEMKMAIEKGKKFGVSAFSIYNCGHIGRMADYSLMAAENDMIGVAIVNASSGDFRGGNGVFMFTLDVSRFGSVDLVKGRVGETIRRVKTSKKAPGVKEIFIPGEPEIIEAEKRLQSGIFVEESTSRELCSIAGGLGVSIPSQIVGGP